MDVARTPLSHSNRHTGFSRTPRRVLVTSPVSSLLVGGGRDTGRAHRREGQTGQTRKTKKTTKKEGDQRAA